MQTLPIFLIGIMSILSIEAFYQAKNSKMETVYPNSLKDLKNYLEDDTPRKIILKKVFDFTNSEGKVTEKGCTHVPTNGKCTSQVQKKLNINGQCSGLTATTVTYSKAGFEGLRVGSNKIIEGQGGGGVKGKGFQLTNSKNVEIRNLKITDINPDVIFGGDGINLIGVTNVLIDNCYFKNIGRQMLVTHFEASTGVLVSNSVFDGRTSYSANCQGNHYWLWMFSGPGDRVALQNNVVLSTGGRGPRVDAKNGQKNLVHIIQNIFYDIKENGLLEMRESKSSVLMEGNIFVNVDKVVSSSWGNVFMPVDANDGKKCKAILGRDCLANTIANSKSTSVKNSDTVLNDFKSYSGVLPKPINMRSNINKQINLPAYVNQHIKS